MVAELDLYFMRKALALAQRARALNEVPIGAVVVDENGEIIGEGYNQPIRLCDPTAHAEILALRAAAQKKGNYRLLGCTLYVTLEPCPMCAGALVYARLKRVVFGAYDLKSGACGSLFTIVQDTRLNHQLQVQGGVLEEEARALLQKFFQSRRRGARAVEGGGLESR